VADIRTNGLLQMNHDHKAVTDCCKSSASPPTAPALAVPGQTQLRVAGMDCPDEVAAIERVLKPLAGVGEVQVNLMAGTVSITHEKSVTPAQLIEAIGTAGLKATATIDGDTTEGESADGNNRLRVVLIIVSAVFTGVSLLLQWQNFFAPHGKAVAAVVAIVAGGWFILPKALRALSPAALGAGRSRSSASCAACFCALVFGAATPLPAAG